MFDLGSAIGGALASGTVGALLYFVLLRPKTIATERAKQDAARLIEREQAEQQDVEFRDELFNGHHRYHLELNAVAESIGLDPLLDLQGVSHSTEGVRIWTNLHRWAHIRERLYTATFLANVLQRDGRLPHLVHDCIRELTKLNVVGVDSVRAGQIVQEASEQTLGQMETIVDVMLLAALRQLDPEGPDLLAQLVDEIER